MTACAETGAGGHSCRRVAPAYVDTPLRTNVLGPDGKPWPNQPEPPFRIWPVEKCVDRLVKLIVKRKAEALLPAFTGPLLVLDKVLGSRIGDALMRYNFRRNWSK